MNHTHRVSSMLEAKRHKGVWGPKKYLYTVQVLLLDSNWSPFSPQDPCNLQTSVPTTLYYLLNTKLLILKVTGPGIAYMCLGGFVVTVGHGKLSSFISSDNIAQFSMFSLLAREKVSWPLFFPELDIDRPSDLC